MLKKARIITISAVILVGAAVYLGLGLGSSSASNWPTAKELAPYKTTISSAQTAPPTNFNKADRVVIDFSTKMFRYSSIHLLQTKYMHCTDQSSHPRINRDCIVVSLNPQGLKFPASTLDGKMSKAKWGMIWIDPKTNKIIQWFLSSE